eukprot:3264867-Pleurochrysis_carterae.AAC.1
MVLSEAVAVQVCQPLLSGKDAKTKAMFAPHAGMPAVHVLRASLHFKKRVSAPSKDSLRRLSNVLTRKGGLKGAVEKRAVGL